MARCIAFRESVVENSVAYMPCGLATKGNRRFCPMHERYYREIVLGIAMAVKQKEKPLPLPSQPLRMVEK